jgi:hypothetical protein
LSTLIFALANAPSLRARSTALDLDSQRVAFIHGDSPDGQFGFSAATGDLDGDGDRELLVGAPGLAGSRAITHTGGVYIFDRSLAEALVRDVGAGSAGSATIIAADRAAAALIPGLQDRGRFGESLAVGDFDGDGLQDLAVGAPSADRGGAIAAGQVAVFFGSVGRSPADISADGPDVLLAGPGAGARLGFALLSVDLDGDGAQELLASAPGGGSEDARGPGVVFVLPGSSLRGARDGGPSAGLSVDASAEAAVVGEQSGEALGALGAGDVDGDGTVDLVLGAYLHDGPDVSLVDAGRIYVISAQDLLDRPLTRLPTDGTVVFDGDVERGFLGRSLSVADVDQDGIDDILASVHGSSAGGDRVESTGEALMLFGAATLGAAREAWSEVPRFVARARWDMFGLPVLLADINGDGYSDAVISSQFADGPDGDRNACGEVYVFRGSLKSVMAAKAGSADRADIALVGGSELDAIGRSLLVADMFGRSAPELLIGAPDSPGAPSDTGDGPSRGLPGRGMLVVIPDTLLAR